jgi:hypothetical protein
MLITMWRIGIAGTQKPMMHSLSMATDSLEFLATTLDRLGFMWNGTQMAAMELSEYYPVLH